MASAPIPPVGLAGRLAGLLGASARAVDTAHGRVHALELRGGGTLPSFVLVHGLAAQAFDWAPLALALRAHTRRVIAIDLPGHGRSDTPAGGMHPNTLVEATNDALDQLVDEPHVLVGNSLGGLIALRAAPQRAELRALVLLSPAGAPSSEAEHAQLRATFDIRTFGQARHFVRRVFSRPRWYHDVLAMGLRPRLGRPQVQALLDAVDHEDALRPDELAAVAVPTLMVWGAQERILPPAHLAFFTDHLPAGARIDQPEGFGHAPFLDDPRALAARLVAFARARAG